MGGQLKGKIAVITGSTQGLGAATARLFAEQGAQGLVICGRSAEKGRAQAAGLEELGAKAVFVQADLERWKTAAASLQKLTGHSAGLIFW